MPQVLGDNGDGTWTVQTDDGRQVRTAYLPPGLAAAPAPPPAQQLAEMTGLGAPAPASGGAAPTMAPLPEDVVSGWLAAGTPAPAKPASPAADELTTQVLGTPRPKGLEFNGFRGDPAVPMRNGEMPGHTQGYSARSEIGGAQPVAPAQPAALRPVSDFLDVAPAAPTAQTQANALVSIPFSGGGANTKDLRDAYAQQAKGVRAAADAAAQQAAAEAAIYDVQAAAARQREVENAGRNQAVAAAVDDARLKYSSLVGELTTPSGQLDPARWWKDRTTGQKVAAYASAFLTGFAGSPNVVQQAIDRDIEAQKDTLDRMDRAKMQRLGATQGLVGMMRERFSDNLLADNAARVAAIDFEERTLRAAAARAQGPQAQAAAQTKLGEIAERKAQALSAMNARAQQLALAQYEAQLKVQQTAAAQQAQSGGVVPLASLTPELLKRAVVVAPGQAVLAVSEEAAKQGTNAALVGSRVLGLLNQAIDMRRKYGSETLPTEATATMQTLSEQLTVAINKAEGLGSADADTTAILKKMTGGDISGYGLILPKLEQLRTTYQRNLNEAFQAYTGRTPPNQDNSAVRKDAPPPKK